MTGCGAAGFAQELVGAGYSVERVVDFVVFTYEVDIGPIDGQQMQIALQPVDHPQDATFRTIRESSAPPAAPGLQPGAIRWRPRRAQPRVPRSSGHLGVLEQALQRVG